MSKAAKNGIIVKYGGVFEALQNARAFFFDKTGTLTLGTPHVVGIRSLHNRYTDKEILRIASSLEQGSAHILAESIVEKAREESLILSTPENLKEEVGKGLSAMIDGTHFLIGSSSYLISEGVRVEEEFITLSNSRRTPSVYLSEGSELIGSILFSDTVRKNAAHVLKELRSLYHGVHLVVLTGDKEERAREIGKQLGLTDVKAECLPEDKQKLVQEYEKKGQPVVMIGDGVNDAPSLAQASVGIALSSHGGTVATDIADAVIMVDDLEKIVTLVKISRRTTQIAKQSMVYGMGLSIIAMGVAFLGYLPPIQGALLQEGIDMMMIVNALRAL
jgi:P-type E1-E2 ATPase